MIKFGKNKEVIERITNAMNSGDDEQIKEAWSAFHDSIAEQIRADFEEVQASNDAAVLTQRGYRQLTSRETNWYKKVINALKGNNPKQAFAEIIGSDEESDIMPETIISDVYKDLAQEYPILNAVHFQHVAYLTKWVLNDHSAQMAVWGEINSEIIKEITSAFKVINVNQSKLSAYAMIERDMLDLGPTFLDGYIRAVLKEALAYGLENGIVNGTGLNQPIGMVKDISEGVSVSQSTGYPDKEEIAIIEITPATYGEILAILAQTEKGNPRKFDRVAWAVNNVTYFKKLLAATKVQGADGKYVSYLDSIYPTDIYICNSVADNRVVVFLPKEYYLLMGGTKDGQIEISDEYKFLEDLRCFKIKQYGAGRAFDNTCCVVLNITNLEPAAISVRDVNNVAAAETASEETDPVL